MFYYCVSFGFWFLGNTLGMSDISGVSVNFNNEQTKYDIAANETATSSAALSPTTVFGDIATGLKIFWQLFSGGVIVNMVGTLFGAAGGTHGEYFTLPIEVIVAFVQILGAVYLITGRGDALSS